MKWNVCCMFQSKSTRFYILWITQVLHISKTKVSKIAHQNKELPNCFIFGLIFVLKPRFLSFDVISSSLFNSFHCNLGLRMTFFIRMPFIDISIMQFMVRDIALILSSSHINWDILSLKLYRKFKLSCLSFVMIFIESSSSSSTIFNLQY